MMKTPPVRLAAGAPGLVAASSGIAELRVLGGPTAAVPGGAVVARGTEVTPMGRLGTSPAPERTVGVAGRPSGRPATAEERWRSAIALRPLETPRPLPSAMTPLVRSIVGPRVEPSYTTGPATRFALAAAGAVGASSGSVLHLPAPLPAAPGAMLGVVAHELVHLRRPATRPRFLLRLTPGDADADEREALDVGRRVQSAAAEPRSLGAGIIDRLPVGGIGPARATAEAADLTGFPGPAGGAPSPSTAAGTWTAAGSGFATPDDAPVEAGGGQGPGWEAGGQDEPVRTTGTDGTAASSRGAGGPGGAGTGAGPVDVDRLAEAVEERVLRQIERRGGRYAGVF
jgi:hypothetical protein